MVNERAEAYKVLTKVLQDNAFSDNLLRNVGKKIKRDNGNHDLFYTIVKGTVKLREHLHHIATFYTDKERFENTPLKVRIIIYMGLYQLRYCEYIPDHAAINETVDLAKSKFDKKVADFINAVLRAYQREPEKVTYPEDPIQRMAVEYSYPEELIRTWVDTWGEDETEMLCMYFNDVPRLNLRVNQLETSTEKLVSYFARKDIVLKPCQASNMMMTTDQPTEVLNDVAFDEGYFSIQDTAAAMVVELLDPVPEESVLDLFAGPGGKTSYIGEKMQNQGEIIAIDRIPNKVKKIKQALERLQINNVRTIVEDSFRYGPVAPAYDRVLLDVPCTGWGVLQKKSELRWQRAQDINELLKIQENALSYGSKFVRPDGYLVYSTCTMNIQENEDQIRQFLKQHPEFVLVDATSKIPAEYTSEGFLKTIPHRHMMDGAFAALMQRKA